MELRFFVLFELYAWLATAEEFPRAKIRTLNQVSLRQDGNSLENRFGIIVLYLTYGDVVFAANKDNSCTPFGVSRDTDMCRSWTACHPEFIAEDLLNQLAGCTGVTTISLIPSITATGLLVKIGPGGTSSVVASTSIPCVAAWGNPCNFRRCLKLR